MTSIIDDLTSFEVAEAEKTSGFAFQSLRNKEAPKVALWTALAWQYKRREDPKLTFDAFAKSHTPDQVLGILYPDDEEVEVDEDGFPDSDSAAGGGAGAESAGATGDDEGGVLHSDGGPAE